VYYYHLDQLNTPRFVTNNSAQVVWENQADVYGYEEPEAESDTNKENTFAQPIRFQGQYLDEESGLHYNRYRYYSPKQQRFINQDPVGLVGGINHYQYAPNPVNWVDPFGLLCKEGQAKVKEALDSDSVISEDLKKKIIAITQLEDSGYTAAEMVEYINVGTAEQLVSDSLQNEAVRKALFKKYDICIGPYKELQQIKKPGFQREHFIPHSNFQDRSKLKGERRAKVPIGKEFGNYNEADAITYFVYRMQ